MHSCAFTAAVLAFGTVLSGCAATTTTSKVAVDYNRIFAQARNEVLVTNILRASAREPLQFSTMGTVTGSVRNSGSIKLPVPSLIGAGKTILSPEFTFNEGINPNVNIIPLGDKEFTEAMLKPVSPETLTFFINQGWDPELILHLVIGGILCPNGGVVFNRGQPSVDGEGRITASPYDMFAAMIADVRSFPIKAMGEAQSTVIRMPTQAAVEFLKEGAGKLGKVTRVDAVSQDGSRTQAVDVTLTKGPDLQLVGLDTSTVCKVAAPSRVQEPRIGEAALQIENAAGQPQGKAVLRSVESIIYFLGETHRYRWQNSRGCMSPNSRLFWPYYRRSRAEFGVATVRAFALFRIQKACAHVPVASPTFAQTKFNDEFYYVLRQEDAGDHDRSLTTLTFLNELIALQTSGNSITSATPVIAISAR